MAKIIKIIDLGGEGYIVRLNDGRLVEIAHGEGHPQLGKDFAEAEPPEIEDPLVAENAELRELLAKADASVTAAVAKAIAYEDLQQQLAVEREQFAAQLLEVQTKPPTVEQSKSPAQEQAQALNEIVAKQHDPDAAKTDLVEIE